MAEERRTKQEEDEEEEVNIGVEAIAQQPNCRLVEGAPKLAGFAADAALHACQPVRLVDQNDVVHDLMDESWMYGCVMGESWSSRGWGQKKAPAPGCGRWKVSRGRHPDIASGADPSVALTCPMEVALIPQPS